MARRSAAVLTSRLRARGVRGCRSVSCGRNMSGAVCCAGAHGMAASPKSRVKPKSRQMFPPCGKSKYRTRGGNMNTCVFPRQIYPKAPVQESAWFRDSTSYGTTPLPQGRTRSPCPAARPAWRPSASQRRSPLTPRPQARAQDVPAQLEPARSLAPAGTPHACQTVGIRTSLSTTVRLLWHCHCGDHSAEPKPGPGADAL